VSVISFQEQIAGWNTYIRRARNNETLVRGYAMFLAILTDFSTMNVLPFEASAAETFSRFRGQGVRVGTMDLRIGSIALVHNLTILTKNSVDFKRIPGLRIEDWTLPSNAQG
jgi:tRNA(fMet)-specific endonuclease VapC